MTKVAPFYLDSSFVLRLHNVAEQNTLEREVRGDLAKPELWEQL
jgi:hypothetical protein